MTGAVVCRDIVEANEVQRILLRPLAFPTLNSWRQAVNESAKKLLGADKAMFQMPTAPDSVYSDDYSNEAAVAYPAAAKEMNRLADFNAKMLAFGVWSRRTMWQGFEREYYRSIYYNELIVPNRAYDSIGMSARKPGTDLPAAVMLTHEHPTGRKFGRRGLQLLRLIHPAFEAGVQAYARLAQRKASLFSVIDGLSDGILIFDQTGKVAHQNPAASAILRHQPVRDLVDPVIRRVVRSLLDGMVRPQKHRTPFSERARQIIETQKSLLEVNACYLGSDLLGDFTPVMITMRSKVVELPSREVLRGRFNLTDREAGIALLLANRRCNSEIAESLGISEHTARHHTERVLRKMGVKSRRHIRDRIVTEGKTCKDD
ncbi:MAG: helix-turn-helix transcriptional regulator [Gemmatimonadota bacterium]|nr:helix-turn-helix transcriptional regulator [Gemmatimonadota bacterium]